jgi:hypothetical protein
MHIDVEIFLVAALCGKESGIAAALSVPFP